MRAAHAAALCIGLALAACTQAQSANPPTHVTASASAPALASASASGTSAKQVELQVVAPEESARAGVEGMGWTVDVIATGSGPAMDRIKPTFRTATKGGKNSAFPSLVVIIRPVGFASTATTANPSGSPITSAVPNLAGLFQVIGLPNTIGGVASISSVSTSATPAPTVATRSTSKMDADTVEATWFVQQSLWGTNVDVELTAFIVDGDAPDTITDTSQLKIVSNEVSVRFHINGSGRPAPTPSATPSSNP